MLDGANSLEANSIKNQHLFQLDKRLRELSKGPREGFPKTMTEADAVAARRSQKEINGDDLDAEDAPILESEQDGYRRFSEWLCEVVRGALRENATVEETSESELSVFPTLVVAHSALLRAAIVNMVTSEDLESHGAVYDSDRRLSIPNASLTVLDIYPNRQHVFWKASLLTYCFS
jgi:broad specificity phosphatase PhoE